MARSVDEIKTDLKTKVRTYPSLNAFKFPEDGGSKVSVFNLMIDVVSLSIYVFEVLLDQLKADIQAIADKAPSGNNKWIQAQMFKFQYGDVIQLVDFVPTYAVVDETKRIITQCAVKDFGNGIVAIKIAKGATPPFSPLTNTELNAVKDYYYGTSFTQGIGFSGVKATFITLNPDRLYVSANIYFLGQYIQTDVKTNVIVAINNFLASFSGDAFNGRIFMIRLIDAIQAVPGVSRVELLDVKVRAATVLFGSASSVPIQGFADTVAGHVISEDDTGHTLDDSLTMIEEVP